MTFARCGAPASVAALLFLPLLSARAQTVATPTQPSRGALARDSYAITDVNVVPMTRDTVLSHMTVLVRAGRIVSIEPVARARVPAGVRAIAGTGKFLMPGLADMHAHLFSDEQVADSIAPDELALMLVNGVTSTRLMIGTPEQLVLRDAVRAGTVLGPQLWMAGPQLSGRDGTNTLLVTTPEQGRDAVGKVARAGYDFVKLTLAVTRPVFDAIHDEARKLRIPVVGHVEPDVGVARALEVKQQIEHLDSYLEAALADSAPTRASVTQAGLFRVNNWRSLDHVSDRRIDSLAGATARAGVWSGPTLNVFNDAFAARPSEAEIQARPEWDALPAAWRALYLRARERYWTAAADTVRTPARRERYIAARNRLVKAIVDSGGHLLAGSDTPEWFHIYGYGLHRELQAYVTAGLTPFQALVSATRAPAEYMGAAGEWGTVQTGRRADLVLLSANPLEDIGNTTKIDAVVIGGRWLSRSELDGMRSRAHRRLGAS